MGQWKEGRKFCGWNGTKNIIETSLYKEKKKKKSMMTHPLFWESNLGIKLT